MYAMLAFPFLLLCGLDMILAAQGVPYRPFIIGLTSFAGVLLLTRSLFAQAFGETWLVQVFVFSAIPAAVCSLLSGIKMNQRKTEM